MAKNNYFQTIIFEKPICVVNCRILKGLEKCVIVITSLPDIVLNTPVTD